jgi:hypothetical protein
MNCINDPALQPSVFGVGVDFAVASSTECGEKGVVAQEPSVASRLVVDVLALGLLAPFTKGVEGKIRILHLLILSVVICAFWGCAPQPARTFESASALQWRF